MKKSTQLKVLNVLLGVLIVSQVLSGLFRDSFPEETFLRIHFPGGLLILGGVILHVILNWGWVKANFGKK